MPERCDNSNLAKVVGHDYVSIRVFLSTKEVPDEDEEKNCDWAVWSEKWTTLICHIDRILGVTHVFTRSTHHCYSSPHRIAKNLLTNKMKNNKKILLEPGIEPGADAYYVLGSIQVTITPLQ